MGTRVFFFAIRYQILFSIRSLVSFNSWIDFLENMKKSGERKSTVSEEDGRFLFRFTVEKSTKKHFISPTALIVVTDYDYDWRRSRYLNMYRCWVICERLLEQWCEKNSLPDRAKRGPGLVSVKYVSTMEKWICLLLYFNESWVVDCG